MMRRSLLFLFTVLHLSLIAFLVCCTAVAPNEKTIYSSCNITWKVDTQGMGTFTVYGHDLYYSGQSTGLMRVNLDSGRIVWTLSENKIKPVISIDRSFVIKGDKGYIAVKKGGIAVLDLATGTIEQHLLSNIYIDGRLKVKGNRLFTLPSNGVISCYLLDNMKLSWEVISPPQTDMMGIYKNVLVVEDASSDVIVPKISCFNILDGSVVWQSEFPNLNPVGSSLQHNTIIVSCDKNDYFELVTYDVQSGKKRFSKIGYSQYSYCDGKTLAYTMFDGSIVGVRSSDGKELWRRSFMNEDPFGILFLDGYKSALVVYANDSISNVDLGTGDILSSCVTKSFARPMKLTPNGTVISGQEGLFLLSSSRPLKNGTLHVTF